MTAELLERGYVVTAVDRAPMDARVAAIADGSAGELVWLLEHPPLYTAGTSAQPADLLAPRAAPADSAH